MLFGVDIAGELNSQMGSLLKAAVLIKTTPGTRTSGSLTDGTQPTETSYNARGFIEDYEQHRIDGTLVKAGDKKITLLGASLNGIIPETSDKVTIEGSTYRIVQVRRDPAAATYTCQARG